MRGSNHYGIEAIWLIYPIQEKTLFWFYETAGKRGDFLLLHLLSMKSKEFSHVGYNL